MSFSAHRFHVFSYLLDPGASTCTFGSSSSAVSPSLSVVQSELWRIASSIVEN